ncbi:hypothetical protein CYMTET_34269 [Cymbomonas tetramitiformis]|uniref:Uncharacterized protein n=1 Tax=Cymbomonas tetramitiformis TaxID=36881 RepID=A0AAE0FBF6_9CHLO|nr:hypothetical protein CYMTET_34269 [Cymbomonas tetramitiformis]
MAKEQRLVRDNRAEDWTPTKTSRKYKMFERLDPDFYAAQAEQGGAVGPKVSGAAYSGVDNKIVEVLGQLMTRLQKIEAAIKFQRLGASSQPLKNKRGKGLVE